jgi:CheY-like chemotaxis protein
VNTTTKALRILVVDDEPLVCDSLKQILALDQHEVVTATSAAEALATLQAGKFDVILLDYEMPDMKGDKLAAKIKVLIPQQPIIMITAYSESLRLKGDFPLAVDLVISKPFQLQELREAVRQAGAKARAQE